MTLLDCARCKAAFPREALPQGPASTCPVCLERGRFFARPSEIAGREARGFLQRERRGPIPSCPKTRSRPFALINRVPAGVLSYGSAHVGTGLMASGCCACCA
jgi:hypothetical protein